MCVFFLVDMQYKQAVYAETLSAYNEGPSQDYPDMILRFEFGLSQAGCYLARLHGDGSVCIKQLRGDTRPSNLHARATPKWSLDQMRMALEQTQINLDDIKADLFFEVDQDKLHFINTIQTTLAADAQEEINNKINQLTGQLIEAAPPLFFTLLEGSSFAVEFPSIGRYYNLHNIKSYTQIYKDVLELLNRIRQMLGRQERLIFAHKSPLATLSVDDLYQGLYAELDTTLAFLYSFIPLQNIEDFLERLGSDRYQRIHKISLTIDATDENRLSLFKKMEQSILAEED